jgi:2-methylcitrate dehydratase PrpD
MNVITDISSHGLTSALAEQARTLTYADLPDDVRALARQCVLDYVACTLAGAKEELTDILLAEAEEQGGKPVATVIGHKTRLPVLSAALVNGAASHALDFDDVNLAMTGHPTVVLLSALLALAEEHGSSGVDVITAFVAGYELQCRRVRAFAWSGRGAVRHRTWHRGDAGRGAEVDVRHDVQAAARG